MARYSSAEARDRLAAVVHEAAAGDPVALGRHGRTVAFDVYATTCARPVSKVPALDPSLLDRPPALRRSLGVRGLGELKRLLRGARRVVRSDPE